ncbi:MAG: helix-hairpin-helix domain-containing protein [Candidatus Dependentiae bacterium]|nr:helix-hairpin-helix domain-containing protein [Candidatus Dependentiae bacterium]
MISAINGVIKETFTQQVLIAVGPIECTLQVPDTTLYHNGSPACLQVYMHWSAENGPSFYGFATSLDKTVFMLIIGCSGIGPKIGLAAIARLGAQGFLESIQLGDVRILSSIAGIGAKKAEQMILHLKHKVTTLLANPAISPKSGTLAQWHTISLTLESLNYSRSEITQTMDHLKTVSLQHELSFDQLLRKALTFLAK